MLSIYNKISDYIIIINYIGEIIFCNESFLNRFNYKKEDILNLNISKIISNIDIDSVLKESTETNQILEIYLKSKDIIKVNLNISKTSFDDNILIIGKEVNSKPYTMDMLEDLLDNMDISTFILGDDGKYIYVNNASSKMLNKRKEEIIGSYNYDYWEDDIYKELEKNNKEVIESKNPKVFNEKLKFGDNSYLYESYKCPIFDKDENLKYIIASTKNINLERVVSEELYKNYNKAVNLNYFINKANDNPNLKEVLNNISESILDYTGADGVSIWLYDKDKEGLALYTKLKYAKISLKDIEFIQIKEDDIYLSKYKDYFNCMIPVEEMDGKSINYYYADKISYYGDYKIELHNEFIGIIGLNYKRGNSPNFNSDEYMKYICNKIAMIIKNIKLSEKVYIENKKREYTEKELQQYLNISVDLIAMIKKDGYFKKLSPNWYNVLGWSEEELLSIYIEDIVHPDDVVDFTNSKKYDYNEGNINRGIYRFKHKNGEYIHLELSSTYLREEDVYMTTARDITTQLEIEKEKKLLEEAIKVESVKNEFFSNISHEFRTPINIILGTMQVINKNIEKNDIKVENLKKYTTYIKQNSYRLLRLVNNLIDINKIDIGVYELRCSSNNIVSIIEDITLSVADYIQDNKINLIFDTNIEEVITYCDPDKIERIMLNLLSNAIKYTPDDGLIEVKINANKDEIMVSVKDSGIGIPKEKLDVIFDRFGQVDDSFNRKCEGSGIGLSLVKNLVEMHGGNVNVNSKINEGSEFIFTIPIKLREEDNIIQFNIDRRCNHVERCDIEFSDIYSV